MSNRTKTAGLRSKSPYSPNSHRNYPMLPIAKLAIVSGCVLFMGLLSACGGSRNSPLPKRPGLQRLQGAKPTPASQFRATAKLGGFLEAVAEE